jgi:hypothetical protein
MPHSPLPWTFLIENGDEVIRDAAGNAVHQDTQYYPSGLATDDAQFIVASVNRAAALEALLRRIDAVVTWETTPLGRGFQDEIETVLAMGT